MKKYIWLILVVLGASDLILWVINDFEFGWIDLIFGFGFISRNGGWIMIALGFWLRRRDKIKEKSMIDDISDVDVDEQIVHKEIGNATIVTVTTKKIIFRNWDITDDTIKNFENVLSDEKKIISYTDIKSCTPIKSKDVANTKLGKLSNTNFGISITTNEDEIYNIIVAKGEIVSAHINKYLNL
jgi:hypothetical protein